MGARITSPSRTTDATTGIPVATSNVRVLMDRVTIRVTQTTGESPKGYNTQPGTDSNAPGNSTPGLPYGFASVPNTGSLGPRY